MYKKNLQYNRKFQGGFSLIELILVIVLIGIFSTIAMTRTNTSLSVIRENIALDQITNNQLIIVDVFAYKCFGHEIPIYH